LVSNYASQEAAFNEEKDVLMEEQIRAMEAEVNRKPIHRDRSPEGIPRGNGQGNRINREEQ
jgi:hypothetical protein